MCLFIFFDIQGFSPKIQQPKSQWVGFIKDYDGGTLMECFIHPDINYLKLPSILKEQKIRIRKEIEKKKPKMVYPGLE